MHILISKTFKERWKDWKLSLLVALIFQVGACATKEKSAGIGIGIGALGGASIGAIADPGKSGKNRTRNVIVGSALGGIAGMVSGAYIHSLTEQKRGEALLKSQASAPHSVNGVMPELKDPQVEARWVEGRAIGNRYVEGHFEYVITSPARWDSMK